MLIDQSFERAELTIEATTLLPNHLSQWKNRLIDFGDSCGPDTFKLTPNDPRINHSDYRIINYQYLDTYRNRFICFEAININSSKPIYGLHYIDLNHPEIINVDSQFPREGVSNAVFNIQG